MKNGLYFGVALLTAASVCQAKDYAIVYTDGIHSLQTAALEDVWAKANVLTDFSFPWKNAPVPKTEFRALWTPEAIWFRFDVEDHDIQSSSQLDKNEAVLASDRVELFFSTGQDLQPYYTAEMDSRGRVFDAKAEFYRKVDQTWNWQSLKTVASLTPNGYRVVGKVDIKELDTLKLWQDKDRTTLMCAIMRGEFSADGQGGQKREWISWIKPDSAKPDFHIPSAFGTCTLVK